ncbi:hypothetical protein AX16_002373 [Volvariella volvacea WC 439]|nr:hypothetical protein AX16_002373 [Volvariella volvacea WC 439]
MEREIEQIAQAIAIASDPTQAALHQQALAFISTVQQNAATAWRLAITLFVNRNPDQTHKYSPEARFFALRVLDEFFDNHFEPLDPESFTTIQQALINYIQSEYVRGSAEADATFLRNKFSHTLTLFFLCTYVEQWPSFFTDLFILIRPAERTSPAGFNHHISLLFFHIVLEISGEVADQMIKSARTFTQARHQRDARVRDAVRERDASRINEAVLTIVVEASERMEGLQKQELTLEGRKELNATIEVVDWGIRTFGSYVSWIDINLTVTPTTVPLLINLLADSSLPIRLATSVALLRIVAKGLKEPQDKLQLLKVLSLGQVVDALESKTRAEQISRGSDVDEGEESYREALGKLLNGYGLELAKLAEEPQSAEIRQEASNYLVQIQPVMLRFMKDEYDDTCNTVFPLLQHVLAGYKRQRKTGTPISTEMRTFLTSLLEVILVKMKWDEEADPEDAEDDDNAEFDKLRKDLRGFLDSILVIDSDLVAEALRVLALNSISAYRNGVPLKWNDAELGVYLVYIFGDINKSGGKGRTAFCQAPAVIDKEKRKEVDYSEFPLTTLGEMLYASVQSGIYNYPHRAVSLQFFETVVRYPDFFKVRKECILPVLEAMIDRRGLHNENSSYRSRIFYLFHRFIKEARNDILPDISVTILSSIHDLLAINVQLVEVEDSDLDPLTEAIKSSGFDAQLYLFETTGVLCSLLFKMPEQQKTLLFGLVRPLLNDLSESFQQASKGGEDLIPIVKVHHIIMGLGNIAKGFPDYPAAPPDGYTPPPIEVFAESSQAILVCLEAMNVWRPIRDAARFAFARILATAGPHLTSVIPLLMNSLLAHFQPTELADFMNLISLLIHKLPNDMFDVTDRLIGPLGAHITTMLSQPPSGTDDQVAQYESKRTYLSLLNNIMASKINGVFISERNSGQLEALLTMMLRVAEDVTDPSNEKTAIIFLSRCVSVWGQPQQGGQGEGLPGFERFIYEQLVPTTFRIPSSPQFNIKDGQAAVVLNEMANLLQNICKVRGVEAYNYFISAFLPSQNWPSEAALEFTTKLKDLDNKAFRKYFTDFVAEEEELLNRPERSYGPEFNANDTWDRLAVNIREILNHNARNLSFEENHRFAYNMVLYRHGDKLYNGVKDLIRSHLELLATERIIPKFPTAGADDPLIASQEMESLLKALRYIWDDHESSMTRLSQILKYMDRVHTKNAGVPEIYDAGLLLFLEHILKPAIQSHIINAILSQIQFERDGNTINRSAVKGCVDVLLSLSTRKDAPSIYKRDLEPALLVASEKFYEVEGIRLVESKTAPEYLRSVQARFEAEESRVHHYLSSQTKGPLTDILKQHLLTTHLSTVLEMPSGLDMMIDNGSLDDLARLYRLYTVVSDGLTILKRKLKGSIAVRGKEINRNSQGLDVAEDGPTAELEASTSKGKGKGRPATGAQTLELALKWVQDVLDLKDKFEVIWKESFLKDRDIESALNEAFESFINQNEKCSEFISLFIDHNLKTGLKGKTDTEVEIVLDKTITVFRYVTEKDVFERYYKSHLAKRLLHGRSVSDDAERGMLAKLKIECGYQFTQKLEGMFQDMKVSADTMGDYRDHLSRTTAPDIELSVIVMTSTFWPMSHSPSPCSLPLQLLKACKSFEQFYLSRHSGRRLTWQPSLGNADVRVTFKARKHELNVSTFALVILLLFEELGDDDFLTYSEIKQATDIVDNELQRHLQSLACAKYKILKKHPPGRDVNPGDSFSFNNDFTAPLQKIKISTISAKVESTEERKETKDRIDEERRHQIEACIVRIMKDRKHMTHNDLINEVTRQLASRFQPDPISIKRRIEGLIEREYLERCEDRKSYNYLA